MKKDALEASKCLKDVIRMTIKLTLDEVDRVDRPSIMRRAHIL